MADYHGTFCGRWHDNRFWARQKVEVESMSEEQAKERVHQIERDADARLAEWRFTQ